MGKMMHRYKILFEWESPLQLIKSHIQTFKQSKSIQTVYITTANIYIYNLNLWILANISWAQVLHLYLYKKKTSEEMQSML